MAVLTSTDRERVRNFVMRVASSIVGSWAVTKTELRTLVDDTDDWIEANQSAYNSAISASVRNKFTTAQKTLVFCYVAMRRAGILQAVEDSE
jgi:hypothetical protein